MPVATSPITTATAHPTFVEPTPITNPKSELQMMMEALANMNNKFKMAITDLNTKVSNLQQGIVPSSQPFEDYGDFTPNEDSNWTGMDDAPLPDNTLNDAHMTEAEQREDNEDHFAIKLYNRLVNTNTIAPGSYHLGHTPSDDFSTVFRKLCKSHSWLPTEYPSPDRLPTVIQVWAAHLLEVQTDETLWAAHNLFGQLSHPLKHYADHPAEFETHFHKYLTFCKHAEHTPADKLPENLYPSFQKFKLTSPTTEPKQVRFTSQPPIDTLPLPPS
jgi:hypothetical protein